MHCQPTRSSPRTAGQHTQRGPVLLPSLIACLPVVSNLSVASPSRPHRGDLSRHVLPHLHRLFFGGGRGGVTANEVPEVLHDPLSEQQALSRPARSSSGQRVPFVGATSWPEVALVLNIVTPTPLPTASAICCCLKRSLRLFHVRKTLKFHHRALSQDQPCKFDYSPPVVPCVTEALPHPPAVSHPND